MDDDTAVEIIGRWNVIFRLDKVLKERKAS